MQGVDASRPLPMGVTWCRLSVTRLGAPAGRGFDSRGLHYDSLRSTLAGR